jgi:serine/threonine protein kinase
MTQQQNRPISLIANRYQVIETKSGGMGDVHFCLDTEADHAPIALKTFKAEFLSDRTTRDRFLREATIWVDLGFHPNIVQAYKALHIAEDQSIYLLMQLIPTPPGFSDPSLRAQIDASAPIQMDLGLNLLLGIVRGMKFASTKIPNLVHRDLKPENVLIGTSGQPKITDFGLAGIPPTSRLNTHKAVFDPYRRQITQSGIMGTPFYMSPEQWAGQNLDCRTDIYAVGCILFEMLTGQPAVNANSYDELVKAHFSGMGVLNSHRANLQPEIKALLTRCLHPNLAERFSSWQQLETEIACLLSILCHQQVNSDDSLIDVSLYTQYQRVESWLAIGSAYNAIGNFIEAQGYFQKAQRIAETQGFPILNALAVSNQGVGFSNQGEFNRAIDYLKKAVEIFQGCGENFQVCMHTGNIGNAYLGLHDFENARIYLEKAFQLSKILGNLHNQSIWTGNLGNLYLAKGDFRSALQLFQVALEISKNTKDQSSINKHLAGLGLAYEGLGDAKRSLEYYKLALSGAQQTSDRQTEGTIYLSIGGLLLKQKKIDESLSSIDSALQIGKEINDQYLTAKALGNLATVMVFKKQTKKAIPYLQEAIHISEQIHAGDISARAHWALGLIYENGMDLDEAIKYLRIAVRMFDSLHMPEYSLASDHLKKFRKALGLL